MSGLAIIQKETQQVTQEQHVWGTDMQTHFLHSMADAGHIKEPYDYWLLDDVLPEQAIDSIANLPFPAPIQPVFNGRREANNSTRVYFNQENIQRFQICADTALLFNSLHTRHAIEKATGANLAGGHLRIEYCQDIDGFWLEPHLDISVKLFTMLIYLSDDPNLFDAGTDIYDDSPQHKLIATAPYEKNKGMIFIPGEKTWHGFTPRTIKGLRKSLIVNYVSPDWVNQTELSYR